MTKNRRGLEWRPRLRFEVYFLREDMLLQAFQYNPLDLCWVASSEGPSLRSQLRLGEVQKWVTALRGTRAAARQRRLAMKRFTPSLACFLIVLGQLCLKSEVEINLSVDFSFELSAVLTLAGAVVFANRK